VCGDDPQPPLRLGRAPLGFHRAERVLQPLRRGLATTERRHGQAEEQCGTVSFAFERLGGVRAGVRAGSHRLQRLGRGPEPVAGYVGRSRHRRLSKPACRKYGGGVPAYLHSIGERHQLDAEVGELDERVESTGELVEPGLEAARDLAELGSQPTGLAPQ
jgi:hypothetical protein